MKTTPLTSQEFSTLKEFIGDCVMENRVFRLLTNQVGADRSYTVQDLITSNIPTLQTIGASLQRSIAAKQGISPLFGGSATEFKIGEVPATMLVDIIGLIIRNKMVLEQKESVKQELALLEAEQKQFITPSEKKKQNQTRIKNVKAMLASLETVKE